jgi:hypothetical protein
MAVVLSSGAVLATALPHFLAGVSSPDKYAAFYRLFYFNDAIGSLAMLLALLLALAAPGTRSSIIRLATWAGEHPGTVAMVAFVCLALGARFVYLRHPFSMDEYAPTMQAHAFAQGQLEAFYPPALLDPILPFRGSFMVVDPKTGGAISSYYWPGLALLQTPFVRLGLDWCLNPAFGALSLLMMHKLASEAVGQRTAGGWAMLAALASPQFTINAMSYYAMPGELALNLLYLWLLLRPNKKSAFAAGLIGGLTLILRNPFSHALMGLPCLLWLAWRRDRWPRLICVLLGYVPLGLGLGISWWIWKNGYGEGHLAMVGADHPGFAAGIIAALQKWVALPSGTLLLARWYAAWKTWIWACPGLLLALGVARQRSTGERLLIISFALTFLFYMFVPADQGHGWGYRYLHSAWGGLPIVAGLWLAGANDSLRRWGANMILAGMFATPAFLWQTHATIKHDLSYRLTTPDSGNWIVFVVADSGLYRIDLVQNPPGPYHTRYLVSQGKEKDSALMARYFPGAEEIKRDYRGSAWRVPQDVSTWAIQE